MPKACSMISAVLMVPTSCIMLLCTACVRRCKVASSSRAINELCNEYVLWRRLYCARWGVPAQDEGEGRSYKVWRCGALVHAESMSHKL